MKRYDLGIYDNTCTYWEDNDGRFVRYQDVQELEAENTRLKELNRGLCDILKSLCESCELGFYDTKNSDPRDVLPCTECGAKAIIARISEWEGE